MDVVTLGMAKADAKKNQMPTPSPVAPANPAPNQLWLSSALKDLRIPKAPQLRQAILTKTLSWESAALQEASTWIANGKYNMIFASGGGQGYASCPLTSDPTKPANWTKYATAAVIPGANHASVYVEGNTVYCFANVQADKTIKVYTSDISDPLTWSAGTTVMTLPAGNNAFGNTFIVKDAGTYYMFIEYQVTATGRWQMGQASSSTLTGTYTLIPAATLMQSLWPDSDHQGSGGASVFKENGEWVMYYHSSMNWNGLLPSEAYRATAPSLGADNWTLTDNKQPIIRRVTAYEVDQVADVELCRTPSGVTYVFWTGMHNRSTANGFVGALHCAVALPTLKRWDGNAWVNAETFDDASGNIHTPKKPNTQMMTADLSGTSTTFANAGVSVGTINNGPDVEVELRGIITHTGTAGDRISFQVTRAGGAGVPLGSVVSDGSGRPMVVVAVCKYTQLTIGQYAGYTLQYKVSAGTVNCRPVAQVGTEHMSLKVTDSAYPY